MILKFNKINITPYIGELTIDSNLTDIYKTINFTLPFKYIKENSLKEGMKVSLEDGREKFFEGICLKYDDENNDVGKFMCVNYMWYLTVYEETFQINGSAKEAINKVVNAFDSSLEIQIESSEFNIKINKIYYETSLESIIKDILSQVTATSSNKYYLIDENGKFKIVKNLGEIKLNLKHISDLRRTFDISNIKNQIKVISATSNKINELVIEKDSKSISEIGTIQKTSNVKSTNKSQAKNQALKLLKLYKNTNKTVSFTVLGNFGIKIGHLTKITEMTYLINAVKHEVKEGIFTTKLSLEAYYE
jgi:hypothetical protein